LTIDGNNEILSITADGTDYRITTSLSGWSGSAASGVTVSGTELRLAKSTFTGTIAINDSSSISGGAVTFSNTNTTATYNADVTITLNDSPGSVNFQGTATHSFGAKNLSVTTSGASSNIVFAANGSVAATTGNVTLTAGGAITLNSGSQVATTSGSVTLSAGTTVTRAGAIDGTPEVSGGTVSINAGSGIGTASAALEINASTLTAAVSGAGVINVADTAAGLTVTSATTANGAITLSATSGALTLTNVVATGGNLIASTLTSGNIIVASATALGNSATFTSAGDIDEVSADSAADIQADAINLTAASGIGDSGAVEINGSATTGGLTASVSGAGSINVADTAGGLLVASATTVNGNITFSASSGDLTLTSVSATGGAINATTTTSGNILAGNVIATNSGVTLVAAGAIEEGGTADAAADVTGTTLSFTAATGIGAAGTLEINATSGGSAGTLTLASVTGNGALDIQDTADGLVVTTATTNNGAVTIAAVGGDLTVATATAGGSSTNMTLRTTTSGNITLTSLANSGDRVTVDSAGSIIDSADAVTDITAANIVLIASTGIGVAGSAADTELETSAANLDVRNATSGGVRVNAVGGNLTLTDIDASGGTHTLSGGGAIVAANALTVSMSLTLDDSFTFTAGNSTSANDDLTINNNALVTLTNAAARTLTLQAGDDLILGPGGSITAGTTPAHTISIVVDGEGAGVADGDRGSVTQDSGSATRLTAATLTITAPDGVGSSGQSVYVSTGVLTVTTSGNNGSQFLVEADGLTEFSLAAGTGSVTLSVAATGDLLSADAAVDIVAATASVTLTAGDFGDTDGAAGNAIETTVGSLTVDSSAGNGDIFIRETDGLTGLNLNAGSGAVLLHSVLGSVADSDGAVDVVAAALGVTTPAGGFGASDNFIGTAVGNLEVNAAGVVFASNSVDLIIGGVNSTLTGIDATGAVEIRATGSLSVNESVTTTAGAVTLQARESATDDTADILSIANAITVSTGAGAITLNGGDGVDAAMNSVITATTTLTVNVDNAAGVLGVDNDSGAGGTVSFDEPSSDPAITAPGGVTVSGGADEDFFYLKPLVSGTLTVNGGGPALPTGGDLMSLDLSNVAVGNATLLLGASAASGVMTFKSPAAEKTVTYTSIEEVSANPAANAYHLVLDMAYSGYADSVKDTIAVERTDGPTDATTDDLLEIEINGTGSPFFSGAQGGILSLTVIGSSDDELFQITETEFGMPQLAAVSPAVGAVTVNNTALTPPGGTSAGSHLVAGGGKYLAGVTNTTAGDWDRTDVAIHFDGGNSPDVDQVKVIMARPHTVAAVGTAALGNLATDLWPAELGGAGVGGLDLLISYANLSTAASVEWVGAGGAVLADGSATSATTEITVHDFDADADDGVNIVDGNNGFTEQKFAGFSWLYVVGGDGAETIRLESLDTNDPDDDGDALPISLVTLDGDNLPTVFKTLNSTEFASNTGRLGNDAADDTLVVEALPEGVTVVLLGGAGNDRFHVFNDNDTESIEDDSVAGFAGTLIVSPAAMFLTGTLVDLVGPDEVGGNDSLVIRDFGDGADPELDDGDTASISSATQDGAIYVKAGSGAVVESVTVVTTKVNGLFDAVESPSALQIVYSQIEVLAIELGAGDDSFELDFQGLSDELQTVTISGNDGNDEFTFASDTPYGAETEGQQQGDDIPVLTIMGEAGDDTFIFMHAAELFGIGTCVDGGEGEDKLDFSSFLNERAIYLVTIGAIDGYQGYEGDWGLARGGGQYGDGDVSVAREQGDFPCFTNIDVLEGSATTFDALYGADRDSYWDLTTLDAGVVMDGIPLAIDAECQCGGYVGQDLAFSDIENIFGGGQRDWFDVRQTFRLTGAIGGGDHAAVSDTLDMRDRTTSVSVNLTELTASFAGGIDVAPDISPTGRGSGKLRPRDEEGGDLGATIENLLGGSGNDTLIGDIDVNWIAGYAGDDTLNGKAGVDSVDGGAGSDILEVAGTEALNDVSVGGVGESLDPLDVDRMVNVGSVSVTLTAFNTGPTDFSNSIDEYDGNGAGLVLVSSGGMLHLGSTMLTDTPTVAGGAGNDSLTISYENSVATAYSAGAGSDSLTLTLEATDIEAMPFADITAIQAFINAPNVGPLTLTGDATKGNFTVAGDFETVRIAVYDSGQIVDITTCFRQLTVPQQIQFGTSGDDSLTGADGTDLIFGKDGTDNIAGLGGVDCLFGGAGNDTVLGGLNSDTIAGGEGDDSLDGEAASDFIIGGLGNDIISGSFGDDTLYGNAGNDSLMGGGDSDFIYGGADNDSLDGQAGNDRLWGQAGDDTVNGSDGDDVLNGGTDSGTLTNHDTVNGGVGNDTIETQGCESEYDSIQGGGGADMLRNIDLDGNPSNLVFNTFLGQTNGIWYIYGNGARITGNDEPNVLDFRITATTETASDFVRLVDVPAIDGCAGDDIIYGTRANDTINGNADDDTIYGYNLSDLIDGGTGDDVIYGGADGDTIYGGDGADVLNGETGNDSIYGGRGVDILNGQEGDDVLDGQQDGDSLNGGVGNDLFRTRLDDSEFDVFDGGAGADQLINMQRASLVLNGFDGPNNKLEQVLMNFSAIIGNNGGNTFDFRYGSTTSFVQLFNVTFVSGEGGDDTIRASDAKDTLMGGDGNDTIYGNGGNDSIDGGGGNDSLYGGNDGDTLFGNSGNDVLDGGPGNDTLLGGVGNDSLEGSDGDDILNGGEGSDSVSGSGGADEIRTERDQSYDDTIRGGIGNDRIVNIVPGGPLRFKNFAGPANGIEAIFGGNAPLIGDGTANTFDFRLSTSTTASFVALNNVTFIDMGDGADIVQGTGGNETIYGRGGGDSIDGWGGNDTIDGGEGSDIINGGAGNDRIEGGDGDDPTLSGGAGSDWIMGGAGVDTLIGGDGDDTLDGGAGLTGITGDRIEGGAGNDSILIRGSEAEYDTILGGAGVDRITNTLAGTNFVMNSFVALTMQVEGLSANNARLLGNSGANTFDLRLNATGTTSLDVKNLLAIEGMDGNDTIHGTKNADSIIGGAGLDRIYGYDGPDSLSGGDGDDSIDGGAGNDLLFGEAGNDTLLGAAGNDSLVGGLGVDSLNGGAGNDIFHFISAVGDATEVDVIVDLTSTDSVRFVGYAFSTGVASYVNVDVVALGTPTAVLQLTNAGKTVTIKRISTPNLKAKPASTRVLFT
jgi:Ca2+-binding RTX toxin-like protein